MSMKILRPGRDARAPRSKTAVTLSLIFCCMGLLYIGLEQWWDLGLLYVAAGLAGFLYLRTGRVLMICAASIGLVVFCKGQLMLFVSDRAAFAAGLNLWEIAVSTSLYLSVIWHFSLPQVKEGFRQR